MKLLSIFILLIFILTACKETLPSVTPDDPPVSQPDTTPSPTPPPTLPPETPDETPSQTPLHGVNGHPFTQSAYEVDWQTCLKTSMPMLTV
ncbi:MAG: hypothetical protein ACRCYY_17270 [Trueperaceae bacterium]